MQGAKRARKLDDGSVRGRMQQSGVEWLPERLATVLSGWASSRRVRRQTGWEGLAELTSVYAGLRGICAVLPCEWTVRLGLV